LKQPEKTELESSKTILSKIFTEYYIGSAKAKQDKQPIAYITAFTPAEILRAMDVVCLYPESYAVVCSASGKAKEMIHSSQMGLFAQDLCSYSLIDFGTDTYGKLPFGGLPQPDMLIAANNQCSTTFLWFRLLAQKKNIPLFIIDYPSVTENQGPIREYIGRQYETLINFIEHYTGHKLNNQKLSEQVAFSEKACDLWLKVHQLNKHSPVRINANKIVDALFPMVVARGAKMTCDYYEALISEHTNANNVSSAKPVRLLWHGYPMWFLAKKFSGDFDSEFQIVLNDYTLWWNLDYENGNNDIDKLITAYSNTYLNWPIGKKIEWVKTCVKEYAVNGVICHSNRSCRRTLADIVPLRKELSKSGIPAVLIESDMANPEFYSKEQVNLRIESLREMVGF
jgi:benzoyl-CoA reductase/2-hydroxyglutaryl-CoA dehydratase subunit BcrC/BadD/HgdB